MPSLQQPGDEAQRDSFSAPLRLRDAGSPAEDHGRLWESMLPIPKTPKTQEIHSEVRGFLGSVKGIIGYYKDI